MLGKGNKKQGNEKPDENGRKNTKVIENRHVVNILQIGENRGRNGQKITRGNSDGKEKEKDTEIIYIIFNIVGFGGHGVIDDKSRYRTERKRIHANKEANGINRKVVALSVCKRICEG